MPRPTAPARALRPVLYTLLAAVIFAALAPITGLYAQDQPAQAQPEEPQEKPEPTLTDKLGGEERYLTHLSTDKPIYREGETVYVRGTILDAFSRKPLADHKEAIETLNEQIKQLSQQENPNRPAINELAQQRAALQQQMRINPMVEIKDAKGATITSGRARVEDSVFGFSWEVPEGQAGGEYTLKVTHPWSGLAPAERKFDIRAYRAPRIKSQIQFLKDGYGPGDTVVATLEATRAEGGIPVGAKVTAIARVDGQEVARVQTMIRETGFAEARFELPAEIERGEGSLAFVIEDGGVVETASKTLPILLQTVDLELYPEGGQIVAGVENRVYFEAKTPYGKPADISGEIVNQEGTKVSEFESTHEGRGRFSFTPKVGETYTLRVTEPASVTQTFELPEVVFHGLILRPLSDTFAFHDAIDIHVAGNNVSLNEITEDGTWPVRFELRHREVVVAQASTPDAVAGELKTPVTFIPDTRFFDPKTMTSMQALLPASATGILTLTAYDADGKPLAERLIYRAPNNHVNIEIVADSAQYTPSGHVQLTIKTTDANGKPVAAVAGLTVTDDSVLEMIETREQAPNLPAMVFLEQEVNDLADAHVYLDHNNPDAAQQLDLLLGTQGWRRFALVNVEQFILEHGDDARRLLALRVPVRHELERVQKFARAGGRGGAAENDFALDPDGVAAPQAAVAFAEEEVEEAAEAVPDAPADPGLPPAPVQEEPELELQAALEAADKRNDEEAILGDIAFDRERRMPQMVFIREYAHKQPAGKPFGQRSDFTETTYWSAATKTDEKGLATISFDLSDSVTSFRVKADAFTADGVLGAGTTLIESVRPFYVEPKLPLVLTAGDQVLLPIAMVNATDRELPVTLLLSKLGIAGTVTLDPVALAADTRGRTLYELNIGETYGELGFNIEARAGNLFDQNKRKLRVVPRGFPIEDGSGGMLKPDGQADDEIVIPDTIVPGSLSASVTVYPTPLANLTEALEALIRNPSGCFEQTSSSAFPLVMAQQYFLTHQGVDPTLIASAREKLDAGYQRLVGFETEKNGYEWFGSTPPHEALTAYGLLEFTEMSKVMDVDQDMITRTSDWLLSRCGEDGSFELDKKALDSFGRAPQDTTDAYIVWSLLEAGYDPAKIQKSIDLVLKKATEGDDAYIIALGANIAQIAAKHYAFLDALSCTQPSPHSEQEKACREASQQLLAKLATKLNDEGFVEGAVTSITNSGGDALKIETTSLAILAWLRDDAYTGQVEKSILWLSERCKAGRFGSTQSTVLALKAIVEYDKARSTPKAPGELILLIDGKPVGEPVAFNKETKGAIKLPDFSALLTPGKHTIAVLMDGGSKMPYTIAVDYHANTPASSEECKLRITTTALLEGNNGVSVVAEGEIAEINVNVTNITKDGLPTPIAIVGLPGGLEPNYDQLKELVKAGTIASFEVIGRDVVLYWRELKPEQKVELSIRCTAAVPGTYTGPASRAYLYYTDEFKDWTDGLKVNITPRD